MFSDLRLIVINILFVILFLLLFLIIAVVLRRILHARKYKELDKQREFYNEKLWTAFHSGQALQEITFFSASPVSVKWQAIEDVLLSFMSDEVLKEDVKSMFGRLGYISYYEKQMKKNYIVKAAAIDKLGKMFSDASVGVIVGQLKDKNPEVIAVSIRALSRIGDINGLKSLLDFLPQLVEKGLVSRKTIETSLVNFGKGAVPVFLDYGKRSLNPKIIAFILEALSNLDDKRTLPFAAEKLKNTDPEVRSKALKAIGMIAADSTDFDGQLVLPLLEDPVWFVRLQAAKVLGNLKCEKKCFDTLAGLLLDEKWQVRNAAATALTKYGNASLEIFLKALQYKDQYAKESICEEIEKTNYVYRLIENLASDNREIYSKSREILNIMHSLNFVTPMVEYMQRGGRDKISSTLERILQAAAGA